MSLSDRYSLQNDVNQAALYVYPIVIGLTLITNILNLCVLRGRRIRSSPCTQYFRAFSFASILYACEVPVMMFLRIRIGFAVTSSVVGCPLQTFVIFILPLFISFMLVLAAADRFFISSPLERIRNLSEVRISHRIIVISVILHIIYIAPSFCIYYFDVKTNQCVTYSSTISIIYLSSRIVLMYILIPLIMTIFGLLTIHNIQIQVSRVAPIDMNLRRRHRYRRLESQLTRILIMQVGAYLVFSIPAGVTYTLVTFITSMNTTFMTQLRIIFALWQQTVYFSPFFIGIFISNTYRREFKHMFQRNYFQDQLLNYPTRFIRRNFARIYPYNNHI